MGKCGYIGEDLYETERNEEKINIGKIFKCK